MRTCENCGADLSHKRAGALYCDSSCRREASRERRLAEGHADVRYASLEQYQARRRWGRTKTRRGVHTAP